LKQVFAFFILLLCSALHTLAKPQVSTPDSIKKLIATDPRSPKTTGKANIDRINKLADEFFESAPDSTFRYANLAMSFANQAHYTKGIADAYINLARVNTFKGHFPASEKNFKYALQLHRQIGEQYGMSEAYVGLGRIKDFLGFYNDAITYLDSALVIRKKLGDEIEIADCYNSMGVVYDNKGEFSKALDYYLKCLAISLKHHEDLASADYYCNIGIIMQHLELYPKALHYFDIALKIWQKYNDRQGISTIYLNNGEVLMAQKKYAEATITLNKASVIFHQMDDKEGIAFSYYDLGLLHYHTNRLDSAVRYLNLSLATASTHGIKYNKAYAYLGLAMVYNQNADYKNAYRYATLAQTTADKLGSTDIRANAALQVSKALAGSGRFPQAYQQTQIYQSLKDSVKSNDIIQKITAYNLEYDFNKSQLEYKRQHQAQIVAYKKTIEDQRRASIIYVIVVLLAACIAAIYYGAKHRQVQINQTLAGKNAEILEQKNNLNDQAEKLNELNHLKDRLIAILAHDLRAPLSTLRGLFNLMVDKEITREEFADMVPQVFNKLQSTSDFLDTLLFWINSQVDDTRQNIKTFSLKPLVDMELEMLQDQVIKKSLTALNNVTEEAIVLADPNSIRIVVHNFLTNAIKFSPNGSFIEIHSHLKDENQQVLTVQDEGIGMSPATVSNLFKGQVSSTPGTNYEIGTGMGLLFCKELIETYNGKIWAESEEGKGSRLCFMLPAGNQTDDNLTRNNPT